MCPEETRDIVLWYCVEHMFDTSNRLGVTHDCDRQTDRRTDIFVANAALNYVN